MDKLIGYKRNCKPSNYLWLYWKQNGQGNTRDGYNTRLNAQKIIAMELKKQGYDVFDTTGRIYSFPVDLIAKRDGCLYGYLVSTRWTIRIRQGVRDFANFLGLKLYVVHVKQDYSWFYTDEVKDNISTCSLSLAKTRPYFEQLGLIENGPEGILWRGLGILPDFLQYHFVHYPTPWRPLGAKEREYILKNYQNESIYKMGKKLNHGKRMISRILLTHLGRAEYEKVVGCRRKSHTKRLGVNHLRYSCVIKEAQG